MIKTSKEYQITVEQLNKFREARDKIVREAVLLDLQIKAIQSQMDTLVQEIKDYEKE